VRVGVLASGAGTNLQAILDRVHGSHGVEVVAVGSDQPGAPALERAARAGIETAEFPLGDDRMARDAALADWLAEREVELVVLAGYMALLDAAFLARFPQRVINVHPALLPAFPGVRSIEQALAYGVKVFGVTVHFVDEGVDSGPVIFQELVAIEPGDTPESLRERVHEVEHRLLPEAARLYLAGALRS
jgi:phosphoribosylglycinamide formyltransferase-1